MSTAKKTATKKTAATDAPKTEEEVKSPGFLRRNCGRFGKGLALVVVGLGAGIFIGGRS